MIEGSLSRRYSKALFELARESGQEESVAEELERFLSTSTESPLGPVLSNPGFPLDSRKKILLAVANSLQLSSATEHFLSLLLDRDRLAFVPSIIASYRHLVNQAKGRVDAKVIAAEPLGSPVIERLRDSLRQLSGKDVILQEEGDPDLIGGLVVEFQGKIYDGSVRTQLEKMKQRVARGF
jgi:F-type H+-transporting ATPase subunit delta